MWLMCVLKKKCIIGYVANEMWKMTPQFCLIMRAKDLFMKIKDILLNLRIALGVIVQTQNEGNSIVWLGVKKINEIFL